MLRNTFCHIQGIGLKSELKLWRKGILSWDDVIKAESIEFVRTPGFLLKKRVQESIACLHDRDLPYFAETLPLNEQWRLFGEFRDSVVYLDIETSGMVANGNAITTIATYDGKTIRHYVRGQNLWRFCEDIRNYKVVVTYNGRCFDIPVIESHLKIRMNHAHIDLRFLLKSLGYTGGLKGCEKKLGLDRDELDGVDGFCAVLLWNDYERTKNEKALETLLAYNILDAVNLEALMVAAYNLKVQETPFSAIHQLPQPMLPQNPFDPDKRTVDRILEIRYAYR